MNEDYYKESVLVTNTVSPITQGVVHWAAHDSDKRKRWLLPLIQKIDLGFLTSQQRTRWLAVLEESNLLSSDVQCILTPADLQDDAAAAPLDREHNTKKLRHNSREEVSEVTQTRIVNIALIQTVN